MPFHFTLQQMRLFEAVVRLRSYSNAAKELHLTQPAVSIQIKRFEEAMGVALLEQVGKKLFVTAAGEEVYAACQDVLSRLSHLRENVAALEGEVKGELKISAVTTAKYILPHLLGAFTHEYPEVEVSMQVTNRSRVLERLHANEGDMVVMGQVPPELDVEVHRFLENRLVVAAAPDHALAGRSGITLEVLGTVPFLVREPSSGTRLAVERLFSEQELGYRVRMELGSTEAIKQAVMAGLGISVLPLHSIALELAMERLVLLDVEGFPLVRHWHLAWPRSKKLSLVARTFIDFLSTDAEQVLERFALASAGRVRGRRGK